MAKLLCFRIWRPDPFLVGAGIVVGGALLCGLVEFLLRMLAAAAAAYILKRVERYYHLWFVTCGVSFFTVPSCFRMLEKDPDVPAVNVDEHVGHHHVHAAPVGLQVHEVAAALRRTSG